MSANDPGWTMEETHAADVPAHELDIYHEAAQPTSDDEFLKANNLGLGNYNPREYWQQVEEFKQHIFGDAAIGGTILEYTIHYTKWELGKRRLAEADTEDPLELIEKTEDFEPFRDIRSRRAALHAIGEFEWKNLGRKHFSNTDWQNADIEDRQAVTAQMQLKALDERANGAHEWTTPQGRMISARHEASRSIGARLMDNLFNRVREIKSSDELSEEDLESGGML